jgi:hypothetical protein
VHYVIEAPAVFFGRTPFQIATTVLFGIVPALRAGAVAPASVIQSSDRLGGAGAGESRLSVALIVVQVAVSLTLTVTAGLLVRSFERLARAPLGFERDHAIVVTINSPSVPAADRSAFYQQLVTAVRGVPGVGNAGGSMNPPIVGTLLGNFVVSEPGVAPPPEAEPFSQSDRITPGLLPAYGMALRAGRDFDERDSRAGGHAMIVNEAFVRRFIHAESAIGRAVNLMPGCLRRVTSPGSKTIVGVVSDRSSDRFAMVIIRPSIFPFPRATDRSCSQISISPSGPPADRRSAGAASVGSDLAVKRD